MSSFGFGVALGASTRVSVLGVTATDNRDVGILAGPQSLVKSSEASGSLRAGIAIKGARGQVQQSSAHDNTVGIVVGGDNCLITANTASFNVKGIYAARGNRCTVSFNTANKNHVGISTEGNANLITGNVALNSSIIDTDYQIRCPSTVTNNDSTNGFPGSYFFFGSGCQTSNNH